MNTLTTLDDMLGVKEGQVFVCKAYFYKLTGSVLQYKHVDGWKVCSHAEVIYVYVNKEHIKISE